MSVVAIFGAGPIGSAIAHKLAERARVREIRLIDDNAAVASGKALDIRQSGPIGRFDTELSATSDALAAAGADAIVFADRVDGGEWEGEAALTLAGRLVRAGASAPFVFAGSKQVWLMEAAVRELKVPENRVVGTAGTAVATAVAALAGVELGLTGVHAAVVGRPPAFVVGWSSATAGGSLISERVPAHRLLAISQMLPRLWPPAPQATGAASAVVIEGLVSGSRQLHHALTVLDGNPGPRGTTTMLPLELGRGRILRRVLPSLSPQERTSLGIVNPT